MPPLEEALVAKRGELTFWECLQECTRNAELLKYFDQLHATNLSLRGSALELEIDKATGKMDQEIERFIHFCWDVVFTRFPHSSAG